METITTVVYSELKSQPPMDNGNNNNKQVTLAFSMGPYVPD